MGDGLQISGAHAAQLVRERIGRSAVYVGARQSTYVPIPLTVERSETPPGKNSDSCSRPVGWRLKKRLS
jgi:hypothetical protein